jgi:hypothetical protein
MSTPVETGARDLRSTFRGPLHRQGDADYDTQRRAFNPAFDSRPAVVAEATGPADVRAAVSWARARGLPLAVQATGHGTHVPADGGVLIKTSRMATVLVDPVRRVAKVGPGARWGEVIAAAAPFGLIPLSGTSASVGVAGYTFGGGFGLLSRRFGLAADSLVRADIVTADGDLVTATRERNADLFWAVRGGGGNFGVATSLEVRLFPVTQVYAGVARFPIERAAGALAFYGEWAAAEPDELTTAVLLDQGETFAIKALYVGTPDDAACALRPLWSAAGEPVSEEFAMTNYADIALPAVAPRNFDLVQSLAGPAVDGLIDMVTGSDAPATGVEVKHWGGAIAAESDPGPAAHRQVPFSVTVNGPPEATAAIKPYTTGGSFLNFSHAPNNAAASFTPENFRRLREVKRAWDPDNVFHRNHNIKPAEYAAHLAAAR